MSWTTCPENLPALLYAHKIQRKAAVGGLRLGGRPRRRWTRWRRSWPSSRRRWLRRRRRARRLAAGTGPGATNSGTSFFAAVNVARHLKVDPEAALARSHGQVPPAFPGGGGSGRGAGAGPRRHGRWPTRPSVGRGQSGRKPAPGSVTSERVLAAKLPWLFAWVIFALVTPVTCSNI